MEINIGLHCVNFLYNETEIKTQGGNMARILVSMPDDVLDKVDGLATDEQRTRSELVREALRSYIKRSKIANPQKAVNNAKVLDELLD